MTEFNVKTEEASPMRGERFFSPADLVEGSLENVKDTLIKWISFSGTPVWTILEMSLAQTCQNSRTPLATSAEASLMFKG